MKLTLSGYCTRTNEDENFELEGEEKQSFMNFLAGKSEKTVKLEKILGIGGEGIVLSDKLTTKEHHYEKGWDEKKGREVAVKFVKFEKYENADLEGPEEKDEYGCYGGIDDNREWVKSQYFKRLCKLGDIFAATHYRGGYSRPYIDFGISKIHEKYFYVIGEFKLKFNFIKIF